MIYKTVTELVKLIQKKEVSSVEILDSLLRRINDKNSQINAVVALDADRALENCLLYTSPSPRDRQKSRMPSSA